MDDVFFYNTGSLFQALNPDQTLANLADESWVSEVTDNFKTVASTDNGTYGAPLGTSMAGGIAYNTKVFSDLGISVPTDWSSLVAAAEKIKAAGITPIEQTYGDTWTSQLFLLADFGNVRTQDENWADDFTNNKAKFAQEPALAGFTHLQDAFDKGLFNADFATATAAEGSAALATGKAAMYPMLSSAVLSNITQSNPDAVADIGFFAMPADKAANTTLTVWEPSAVYIPKTTEGAKLDAAKKFVAFVNSPRDATSRTPTTSRAARSRSARAPCRRTPPPWSRRSRSTSRTARALPLSSSSRPSRDPTSRTSPSASAPASPARRTVRPPTTTT